MEKTFEFKSGVDAITATVHSYGVSFRGAGPRGGSVYGPGSIPTEALPGFLAFLAEHGLTDAELANRGGALELELDNKRQGEDQPIPLDVDRDGMNDNRAAWALAALEAFQAETGTDDCDAIGDLIADLLHLCDREGDRFGWSARDKIERGVRAYHQEITDEEPEEVDAAEVVGAI